MLDRDAFRMGKTSRLCSLRQGNSIENIPNENMCLDRRQTFTHDRIANQKAKHRP